MNDRSSETTSPECECKIGSKCLRVGCCYYGSVVPTNVRSPLIPPYVVGDMERLRAAVAYCRTRLKHDAYRETLDAILRGEKDESIRKPDFTPMVLS